MVTRIKKIVSEYALELLAVFCVVWLHNSYFMQKLVPGIYRTLLPLFLSGIVFFFQGRREKKFILNNRRVLVLNVLICHYTITFVAMANESAQSEIWFGYISVTATMLAAMLLSEEISFRKFIHVFSVTMYWICLISVVFFFTEEFAPSVLNLIPDFLVIRIPRAYGGDSRVFFYTFYQTARDCGYFRNHGIFVEPGMFQIYINIALIFQLFFADRYKFRYIAVYLIGMATCASTTGLFVAVLIFVLFLLRPNTWEKSRNLVLVLLLAGAGIFLLSSDFISKTVMFNFQKLSQLSDDASYGVISSGAERKRALNVALKCWLRSPILGVGPALSKFVLDEVGKYIILTATPVNWFTIMGAIPGLLFNTLLFRFTQKVGNTFIESIFLWITVLLLISTQSMELNLFLVLLCFMGI